ncbi:ATP-binding cassette domain-containing protein [Paenibacillus sp. CC-CFT747]|nr:ATP-binding cassette domain-containing protein [Paenibacillus sp. CC-CFT747]
MAGKNLGIIFQFFQLIPTLSLVENVMLPMDFCGTYPSRDRKRRALELLDRVGMAEQAGKMPSAVSGGQQQRVAIARALANDPPILVADEPTGSLDSKTAESVFGLFRTLADSGKTVVMVTHDNDLAQKVRRTVVVADGEVVSESVLQAFPVSTSTSSPSCSRFSAGGSIRRARSLSAKATRGKRPSSSPGARWRYPSGVPMDGRRS